MFDFDFTYLSDDVFLNKIATVAFINYANEIEHERQYVKYNLDCLRKASFHNLECFGPKTFLHKNDAIFNFSKV